MTHDAAENSLPTPGLLRHSLVLSTNMAEGVEGENTSLKSEENGGLFKACINILIENVILEDSGGSHIIKS